MPFLRNPPYPHRLVQDHLDPKGPRFAGGHSRGGSGDRNLRIVTFNVKFARHIERALALFKSSAFLQNLDVLALQEMDEHGVERIARRLKLNYVYYPAVIHSAHGKNFGNAVLSPWKIIEDRKILLPHPSRLEKVPRIAVTGTILVEGRPFRVYSLHLGTALEIGPKQRREQVETVLADAGRFSGPVIIVGDMNARGIGRTIEKQGYLWATKPVRRTISLFAWDHIFIRGFQISQVAEVGVVRDTPKASDHKPVWMVLGLDRVGPGDHPAPSPPRLRKVLPGIRRSRSGKGGG
jgi:endonuclease/exonuclease/phosphatase family metal-dependent hydrolase